MSSKLKKGHKGHPGNMKNRSRSSFYHAMQNIAETSTSRAVPDNMAHFNPAG